MDRFVDLSFPKFSITQIAILVRDRELNWIVDTKALEKWEIAELIQEDTYTS